MRRFISAGLARAKRPTDGTLQGGHLHANPGENALSRGLVPTAARPRSTSLVDQEYKRPMSRLSNAKIQFTDCRLSLLALLSMVVVVSGLLVVVYFALHARQEAEEGQIQRSLEDRARSIGHFFSERENDMREIGRAACRERV